MSEGALGLASGPPGPSSGRNQSPRQPGASPPESLLAASLTGPWAGPGVGRAGPPRSAQGRSRLARRSRPPHFPRFPQPDGPRIRTVADPVIEGRSLVLGGDTVAGDRLPGLGGLSIRSSERDPGGGRRADARRRDAVGSRLGGHRRLAKPPARRRLDPRDGPGAGAGEGALPAASRRAADGPGHPARRAPGARAVACRSGRPPRARVAGRGTPGASGSPSPSPPAPRLLGGSVDRPHDGGPGGNPAAGRRLAQRPSPQRAPRVGSARRRGLERR